MAGLARGASTALSPRSADLAAALGAGRRGRAPLLWVGGGARDAGDAVARLAERLAAPVLTTYGAAGILPPGHPAGRAPAARRAAGRLWDEADLVLAIGSDLDGVQTQNFAQPQPRDADRGLARAAGQLPRRRPPRRRGGRGHRPRWRTGSATAAASTRSPQRLSRRRAEACGGARRHRAALPRRDPLRRPRRRRPRRRHVHPGLLARRLPHARRPAPPAGPARLGNARLRASRPRSAPRSPAPTARSSRSPATAASSSPAASSPRSPRSRSP